MTNAEMELFMHRKVYDTIMDETTLTMEQAVHVVESMQNKGVIFTEVDLENGPDGSDERAAKWFSAIVDERSRQIHKGYGLEHDRRMGIEHLLSEALEYGARGRAIASAALVSAALDLITSPLQSNLVDHARRELEAIGEDPETIEGYLSVIQAFADQGHSGGSASVAIPTINQLLQFKNLGPITADPKEWFYHGRDMWDGKTGIWQNIRNGEAFSDDGGKTYYLLSDGSNSRKKGKTYRSQKVSGVHPNPIRHRRKGR